MAQWGAPSPTLFPLILRHSFAVVRDRNRLNPFSEMKFGR
jgi:hypothetical protein